MDNVLGHLSHIDFLKIDTQGSEYEILEGAINTLPNIRHIKCEAEFTEWYKGQRLAKDVISFLKSKGFELTREEGESATHSDFYFINKNKK